MKSFTLLTILLTLCLLSGCTQVAQEIFHTPLPQLITSTSVAAPHDQGYPPVAPTHDQGYPPPREPQPLMAVGPSPIPTPYVYTTPTTPPLPGHLTTTISGIKGQFAYIGLDGNLWLADPLSGALKRITERETGLISHPQWSSDGKYLAYRIQTDDEERADTLWVYDAAADHSRFLLEKAEIGEFDWQPGTHIIAYDVAGYKNSLMGKPPDPEHQTAGIEAVNIDGGEPYELIPAQETDVILPHWSGDGRTLGFINWPQSAWMGEFNCYSADRHTLSAWKKWIGNYDLSPDGHWVVYDNNLYPPSWPRQLMINTCEGSDERVLVELPKGGERALGRPVFSPSGDSIAYFEYGIPHGDVGATTEPSLMLLSFPTGVPRQLVSLRGSLIDWLPDESGITIDNRDRQSYRSANGHWMGMITVVTLDGTIYPLVIGDEVAWQPVP